jgi:hypothetical protein
MDDRIRISESERERLVTGESREFPKYTTQILNPANQNAQSTRPRVVGQMNEIIDEFRNEHPNGTYEDWVEFYFREYDGEERIDESVRRLAEMVDKMREAMEKIDEDMIRAYIEDLVLYKTYEGFDIQDAILQKLAQEYKADYSRATAEDEPKGIDGYLGDQPVSVKPETYNREDQLQEDIQAPIVYYEEYSSSDALQVDITELNDILDSDDDDDPTLDDSVNNN